MSPRPAPDACRTAARIYVLGAWSARGRLDDPHVRDHHTGARVAGLALITCSPLLAAWGAAWDHLLAPRWPGDVACRAAVLAVGLLTAAAPLFWVSLRSRRAAGRGEPPLFASWTRRIEERHLTRWRQALLLAALLALLAVVGFARRGERLAERVPGVVPRCWLLFDDNIGCPPLERRLQCLAFTRVAAAACDRWGPGAATVQPLLAATLREALASGQLVFVASHGHAGKIPLEGEWVDPGMLEGLLRPGPRLRLVYFGACEAGRARWDQALAPAEVVASPEVTTVLDHAWWLWVDAPGLVRRLPEEGTLAAEEGVPCPAPR